MSKGLCYQSIFDAITDDPAEAAELQRWADKLIADRDRQDRLALALESFNANLKEA